MLGALAGRVGATWVTRRGADPRADDPGLRHRAEDLGRTLGKMRGAAMKLGQSLAIAADHLDLAPELRMALGTLHAQGEPIPFAAIRATVEAELGAPLQTLFAHFDEAPLGTASLAQAHAARLLDGRRVVVKVLHEGVEEAVASDLSMIGAMPTLMRALGRWVPCTGRCRGRPRAGPSSRPSSTASSTPTRTPATTCSSRTAAWVCLVAEHRWAAPRRRDLPP